MPKYTAADSDKAALKKKAGYTGVFPVLYNGRDDGSGSGWYQHGDGMSTLKNYPTQIKRVQDLLNWINDGVIAVDGKYGRNTVAACKLAQSALGVTADGVFGRKTLEAAKAYRK